MKLRSHAAFLAMSCALAFAPVQLLVAVPAEAASCASLTSELRELQSRGNRPSAGAQKWQTAKSQQKKALSAAERDFSYLGCNSNASPQCQALSGKVQRMRSNLRAIDRQLAKAGGGNASNQKRIRQLQAALKRQNCGAPANTRNAAAIRTLEMRRVRCWPVFSTRSKRRLKPSNKGLLKAPRNAPIPAASAESRQVEPSGPFVCARAMGIFSRSVLRPENGSLPMMLPAATKFVRPLKPSSTSTRTRAVTGPT